MDNLPENETRGLKMLHSIIDATVAETTASGFEAEQARQIGRRVADRVRKEHGGEQVYLSKGLILDLQERDWQIWEDFTGSNHLALAKAHDLTERMIYNILAACRVEYDRLHQLSLF